MHSRDYYLWEILLQAIVAADEGNGRNETWAMTEEIKLEYLYKVGSECELNSCSGSSVGKTVTASEQKSVVVGSNPTQVYLLKLLLRILQWWILYVSVHSAALMWFPVRDFA